MGGAGVQTPGLGPGPKPARVTPLLTPVGRAGAGRGGRARWGRRCQGSSRARGGGAGAAARSRVPRWRLPAVRTTQGPNYPFGHPPLPLHTARLVTPVTRHGSARSRLRRASSAHLRRTDRHLDSGSQEASFGVQWQMPPPARGFCRQWELPLLPHAVGGEGLSDEPLSSFCPPLFLQPPLLTLQHQSNL